MIPGIIVKSLRDHTLSHAEKSSIGKLIRMELSGTSLDLWLEALHKLMEKTSTGTPVFAPVLKYSSRAKSGWAISTPPYTAKCQQEYAES